MRGVVVKCEPLTGDYQFELYLRDEKQSYGPLYLAVQTKYLATRKFLCDSKDEAAEKIKKIIRENPGIEGHFKQRGSSKYVIELRGKDIDNFLSRYYHGCFDKVGNADYLRTIADFPFFCLDFDTTLSMCLLQQKTANRELRKIYNEVLFPMRLEGKTHKDVLKRLKEPEPLLEEKLKPVHSTKRTIDILLENRGKSEIDFITLKIYLDSLKGIKFENGA